MCGPAAVMVGMAVMSAVQQQQASKQQAEAATDAQELYNKQLGEAYKEQNQQSALQESERIKQGMVERAKISTIAGESGALGLSSDRLIGDSFMQQGTDMASIEQNRLNSQNQRFRDGKTAENKSNSLINDANNKAPTVIGTGLSIASAYYSGKSMASTQAKSGVQS
jgi:hypothetical protein